MAGKQKLPESQTYLADKADFIPQECRSVTLPPKRTRFSAFNAPVYFAPNSFMYKIRNGGVDVADYHET